MPDIIDFNEYRRGIDSKLEEEKNNPGSKDSKAPPPEAITDRVVVLNYGITKYIEAYYKHCEDKVETPDPGTDRQYIDSLLSRTGIN